MKLYSDYIREREGFETFVFKDCAFMTFKVQGAAGEEFYIRDMYVDPDHRRKKICWEMADAVSVIAKERGCKHMVGTVYRGAKGGDESLRTMLAYGFKLYGWDNEKIALTKDL